MWGDEEKVRDAHHWMPTDCFSVNLCSKLVLPGLPFQRNLGAWFRLWCTALLTFSNIAISYYNLDLSVCLSVCPSVCSTSPRPFMDRLHPNLAGTLEMGLSWQPNGCHGNLELLPICPTPAFQKYIGLSMGLSFSSHLRMPKEPCEHQYISLSSTVQLQDQSTI